MTQQITLHRETLQTAAEALQALRLGNDAEGDASRIEAHLRYLLTAALANAEPVKCAWTQDPDFEMGDTYHSACGEVWSFTDGGPAENRVRYCQGCGKPVQQIKEPK